MVNTLFDRIIGKVFRSWKARQTQVGQHPDEEALAGFLEGRLSAQENLTIKSHLVRCRECALFVAMHLTIKPDESLVVPQDIIAQAKDMVVQQQKKGILELTFALREKMLELLSTTGDVLVGQEFIPSPVLRSRSIRNFEGNVVVLKDFKGIRVEIRIENEQGYASTVTVIAKNKLTQEILKDVRITLLKEDVELESYLSDSGQVTFQHIVVGKYTIEISGVEETMASVILEIKK